MFQANEINDIRALSEFRGAWTRLLSETLGATFFQSLEWLEVYWQHFGGEQQLRVIVVGEPARPTGIVPLVVRREPTRVGAVRFLTYPLDYWGSFYGPIGPRPAEALQAALCHVRRTKRDWDTLELRWIGGTDAALDSTVRAMTGAGLQAHTSVRDQAAVIDLSMGWEEYLKSRTSKWRNNYRRGQRTVNEAGRIEYLRYRPRGEAHSEADPRWDLYDACLAVAQSSWQGSSETGTTLTHDSVSEFFRDVHAAAARFGGLDLNLLFVDDVAVAFAYNYSYLGSVYGLRAGFDPAQGPPGSGNYLYARAIQDSFQRGDELYDLGTGHLKGKRYLQTGVRAVYRCGHFPLLSLRSQLLRAKRHYDGFVGRA